MPNYDYLCTACNDQFEAFQSMTAEPLKRCKKCGKMKLKRLIGAGAAVLFKGTGFYQTDYKSSASGGKKADASKAGKSGDSST